MIYSIGSAAGVCESFRGQGKKIVLVTGFFDLLHSEHLNFLRQAKVAGDILVAAVESDERARQLKGEGRPVESQSIRCRKVADYADLVIALPPDFDNVLAYESLLQSVHPHIYAVSSHTNHLENKQKLVEKYGGKLEVVHEWNPAISTTLILDSGQKQL